MAAVDDVSDPMVDDLTANLPDALLLHVLEYLVPSLADIGRCCRISSRFATIAADDQIWTAICTQCFGLTSVEAPDGTAAAADTPSAAVGPVTYQASVAVLHEALSELRRSLTFELRSSVTHEPVSSLTLAPDERLLLQLIIHPSPSANLLALLPLEAPLLFGVLHVQSAAASANTRRICGLVTGEPSSHRINGRCCWAPSPGTPPAGL